MTRFYPECDSYECEVCPRREDCDIREEDDEDGIPLEADPAQTLVLDEMEHRLRALERELSELRAALGRWVGQVEGGDYGAD